MCFMILNVLFGAGPFVLPGNHAGRQRDHLPETHQQSPGPSCQDRCALAAQGMHPSFEKSWDRDVQQTTIEQQWLGLFLFFTVHSLVSPTLEPLAAQARWPPCWTIPSSWTSSAYSCRFGHSNKPLFRVLDPLLMESMIRFVYLHLHMPARSSFPHATNFTQFDQQNRLHKKSVVSRALRVERNAQRHTGICLLLWNWGTS